LRHSRECYVSFASIDAKHRYSLNRVSRNRFALHKRIAELLPAVALRVDRSSRFSLCGIHADRRLREQCSITVNSRAFLGLSRASSAWYNQRRVTPRVIADIPRSK
jgi:hypothetical protein